MDEPKESCIRWGRAPSRKGNFFLGGGGSGPLKAQKLPAAQYTVKKITNPDVNYNAPNWPVSH